MKTRFFIFLLMISLLFAACGGAAEQETSITMNAGKVARYLGRNISREGQNGFSADDLMAYTYYGMRIEVYTEGSVKSSDKKEFKASMEDWEDSLEFKATMEELYNEAGKADLKLSGIPVGSVIKVHAKLTIGEMIDEQAYKDALLSIGMPEEYVNEELAMMLENMKERQDSVEGESEQIEVTSGPNQVTIKIKAPLDLSHLTDDEFNIILYTNVENDNDNGLWSYKMETNASTANYTRGNALTDEISEDIIDFVVDASGDVYYSYMSEGYYLAVDYVPHNGEAYNVCSDMYMSDKENSKIYINDRDDTIFFGGKTDTGYEISAHPIDRGDIDYYKDVYAYPSQNNVNYNYFDFAVALGEMNVETSYEDDNDPDSQSYSTYTFADSTAYIAALEVKESSDGGGGTLHDYDIIITKIPMTYKIEEREAEIESVVVFEDSEATSIKLSEAGIKFPYNKYRDYPYSVSDMIILDNYLYILLSGDRITPYESGSVDYPYNYPVMSNGAMLKIDLSNFTVSGISDLIGYNPSNVSDFSFKVSGDEQKEVIFKVHQPASETDATFFNPRKFIGINPKKLVIADDGIFYYKDGNDFCYKNVDRLFVYIEGNERMELKAYTLNTSDVIKFEKNNTEDIDLMISGSNFGEINVTSCLYKN